jgi:hypothetical protein
MCISAEFLEGDIPRAFDETGNFLQPGIAKIAQGSRNRIRPAGGQLRESPVSGPVLAQVSRPSPEDCQREPHGQCKSGFKVA